MEAHESECRPAGSYEALKIVGGHGGTRRMARPLKHAFTIIELLVVIAIIALLIGLLAPAAGKARDNMLIAVSRSNLRQLGVAHVSYSADWADRQVTYTRDDLGLYGGNLQEYNAAIYGVDAERFDAHPAIIAGWGYDLQRNYILWAYFSTDSNHVLFQPINFPGLPNILPGVTGSGWFRFAIQGAAFNSYVNNRVQDPIFFAPKDQPVYNRVQECFAVPGQFVAYPPRCNPSWASYCMSVAALFDPHVFADNGDGEFFNEPWEMPSGYRVPSFGQIKYPDLKTQMIEYNWLQNPSVPCNPAFAPPQLVGADRRCEPYYFNHSFMSKPATLFYDGSVRLTSVVEMMSADRRHQRQAGYGLWSRDTPFGDDGYYISDGYDFAETSFHMLTTHGVRGRDTTGRE